MKLFDLIYKERLSELYQQEREAENKIKAAASREEIYNKGILENDEIALKRKKEFEESKQRFEREQEIFFVKNTKRVSRMLELRVSL